MDPLTNTILPRRLHRILLPLLRPLAQEFKILPVVALDFDVVEVLDGCYTVHSGGAGADPGGGVGAVVCVCRSRIEVKISRGWSV